MVGPGGRAADGDAAGGLDWSLHFVDGTTVRAHQHAAGPRNRGGRIRGRRPGPQPLARRVLDQGPPPGRGRRHEQHTLSALLDRGAIERPGRGRPKLRPKQVAGDKGYSSRAARGELRRRGIGPVVPRKRNERRDGRFDRAAYRERNRVERLINRLKQHRAIATRYAKLAAHDGALPTIGYILLWL